MTRVPVDSRAAQALLRQGDAALARGDRDGAHFCVGMAAHSLSLGTIFAARILSEALLATGGETRAQKIRSAA